MKKNALYIHGFMGNPKGGTFETLTKTLSNWNIHSIPFPDLHTDISKTQQLIKSYCKEVLSDFRKMEKYENIPEKQKPHTFGIFARDDELFHFKDSFDKLFCYKESKIPNSILINGHHSIEEEYLTGGLQQAEKYF